MTTDMTKGSEFSHIIKFALPMLGGNIFQQLYNIADSVIVGRFLGSQALAAVGATGSITFLFYNLCIGLATGSGILIGQSFGAGNYKKLRSYIVSSAYALGILGLFLSVFSVILAPFLLRMLGTPESIIDASVGYMRIACAGTLAVAAYNWIGAVMRSLGDSKTPLYFLVAASIINIVLDLLFVCGLNMGVNGAAAATVTAQAISAAGCILYAKKRNRFFELSKQELKPDCQNIKKCISVGMPIAMQNAMVSVSMIYLQKTANRFGDEVIAAYTATMRIEQLVQQPFSSLNAAVSAFTGQNMGAGNIQRAVSGFRKSLKAGMVFAVAMGVIFLLAGSSIVGMFVDESGVIAIGAYALKVSALFYIFLSVIHVVRGFLNGAGDVRYAMINGFAEVIGRIGFATLLVNFSSVGYMAVWGTTCLTWMLTAIMSIIRYRQGKWKNCLN